MKRARVFLLSMGVVLSVSALAQSVDIPGMIGRTPVFRQRLPTNNPAVSFEVNREGGAVFYAEVQPFVGVAITPDGRNLYLGK